MKFRDGDSTQLEGRQREIHSDPFSHRRATVADAEALSQVATQAFIESFGHLYPDQDLQAFLRGSYSLEQQARFLTDEGCAIWLLEDDDGDTVGYALAGACDLPHPDVSAGDGELKRLYVLPRAQNHGGGGRLFQAALQWLERAGSRTLWIGVWSQNPGAQRFYARHGFARVGEYEFPVGRVRDREFILRREAGQRGFRAELLPVVPSETSP